MNCSYVINTDECICVRNEHFSNQNDSDQNDNNQTEHFKQSRPEMAWRGENKISPEIMNIANKFKNDIINNWKSWKSQGPRWPGAAKTKTP